MRAKARENWSQLWASIKNAFTSGTPIEDPKAAAAEQSKENWKEIWAEVKEAFTSGEGVEDPKVEAANKAKELRNQLGDANIPIQELRNSMGGNLFGTKLKRFFQTIQILILTLKLIRESLIKKKELLKLQEI